jgi:hypothetical protein
MDSKARKRSQGIIAWPEDERSRERLLRRVQEATHSFADSGLLDELELECLALHNGELIIAHGMADHATGFATVPLDEVLAAMH